MSDRIKERRRRIGWALLAALVLYPLSVGPAFWISDRIPGANPNGFSPTLWLIYAPVFRISEQSTPLYKALCWYVGGGLVPRPTSVPPTSTRLRVYSKPPTDCSRRPFPAAKTPDRSV